MKKNITFVLNGENYCTNRTINIYDLVEYFNYNENNALFVLEYNSFVCSRNDWEKIWISDLDKIEIVTIVGGG